jgi:hypothetical protein
MTRSREEIATITRHFLVTVARESATRAKLSSILSEKGPRAGTALAALISESLKVTPPLSPDDLKVFDETVFEVLQEMPPESWNLFNTTGPPYHTEIEEEGE